MRCCWSQVNEKNELLIDRSIGSLYTTTTMFNCTFRFYLSRFSTHIALVFVKGNIDSNTSSGIKCHNGIDSKSVTVGSNILVFLYLQIYTRAHFKNSSDKKLKHISLFLLKYFRNITVTYSIRQLTRQRLQLVFSPAKKATAFPIGKVLKRNSLQLRHVTDQVR
jgi:hypothetical protein